MPPVALHGRDVESSSVEGERWRYCQAAPSVSTGLRFARRTAWATGIFVAVVALRWSAGADGSAGFNLLLATVAVVLVLANLVGLFVLADSRPPDHPYDAAEFLEAGGPRETSTIDRHGD